MPIIEVSLDGCTGKTLQNFFANQVNSNNYNKEIGYEFYQSRNNDRRKKASFTITQNPTTNQHGNGFEEFLDLDNQFLRGIFTQWFRRCAPL